MLTVQKDIGLVGIDQTQSIVLSRLVDISHDVTAAESQRLVAQAKLITMQSAPPDVLATLSGDPVLLGLKQTDELPASGKCEPEREVWREESPPAGDSLGTRRSSRGA